MTFHLIGSEGGPPPVVYLDWRPFGFYCRVGSWRLMVGPSFGDRPLVERV